jgi:ATP synthase in type III secretion protein N
MEKLVTPEHRAHAQALRGLIAKRRDLEFLIQVGEYRPGQDAQSDRAVERADAILDFLQQITAGAAPFDETARRIAELVA